MNTIRAVVTLMAVPAIAPMSFSAIFLKMATTPKQNADRIGSTRCQGRKPTCRPPIDSSVAPATITIVPERIGSVTCSPSSRMARPVETSGFRLLSGEAIEAPRRWMAMKRRKRPATVPMTPASTKSTIPFVVG